MRIRERVFEKDNLAWLARLGAMGAKLRGVQAVLAEEAMECAPFHPGVARRSGNIASHVGQ